MRTLTQEALWCIPSLVSVSGQLRSVVHYVLATNGKLFALALLFPLFPGTCVTICMASKDSPVASVETSHLNGLAGYHVGCTFVLDDL
jgi:hypothetical protein